MNRENLAYLRQDFPLDMADLITTSDFVEVRPKVSSPENRLWRNLNLYVSAENENKSLFLVTAVSYEFLEISRTHHLG